MTDFWFSLLWSVFVTGATLLGDWLAGRLVTLTRCVRDIRRAFDQALTDDHKIGEIEEHLERLQRRTTEATAWGADLATVALALDVAALGLWSRNGDIFPFFSSFNNGGSDHAPQLWIVIIVCHLFLLVLSLVLKHLHADAIGKVGVSDLGVLFTGPWWKQNVWMLASNLAGFVALLSTFLYMNNVLGVQI